jgi:hypothetical protein
MYIVKATRFISGKQVSSYLNLATGYPATLSAKHKATKFNTLQEAEDGTCWIQDLTESFGDVTLSIEQIPEGE